MKLNITRNAARLTLFAAALSSTTFFAGSANAQSPLRGKFNLQHETRWGRAVIPAGHYTLTFDNNMSMLVIRDAKSRHVVAYESANIRQDSTGGESALLIAVRGQQWVVHALRVVGLRQTFIYDREFPNRPRVQEASQMRDVPVTMAKK